MPPGRVLFFTRSAGLCALPQRIGWRTYVSAESKTSSLFATNLENFRDVSKRIPGIKRGLLFRSARLEVSGQEDVQQLGTRYGIKSIVDLRSKAEEEQSRREDGLSESPAVPGATYHYMDLHGPDYIKHVLRQLSIPQSMRFALNVILRRPKATTRIAAETVMKPNGLIGIAADELEHSGKEIRETFELLANQTTYPALIQCSYGKDRTGLIIFLLLSILRAPQQAIVADYCESARGLHSQQRQKLIAEQHDMGLPAQFADAPQSWVPDVTQYLESTYGGVNKYMDSIGVDEAMRQRIRENLVRNPEKQLQ